MHYGSWRREVKAEGASPIAVAWVSPCSLSPKENHDMLEPAPTGLWASPPNSTISNFM